MFNNTEGTGNALVTDISRVAQDVSHATINNYALIVDICNNIPPGGVGIQGDTGYPKKYGKCLYFHQNRIIKIFAINPDKTSPIELSR